MKKIGLIIFISALVVGVILANVFSFGGFSIKSPISISFGKVKGSGNYVTETREVREFSKVKVGGVFKVEIIAQKDFDVKIEADDNIIPLIKTRVRGNTLKIERRKRFSSKNPVIIKISAPNIEELDISGVANTKIENLNNESLKVESSGASSVKVAGNTQNLKVDMSGASRVNTVDLNSTNAKVEGSGASNIKLNVAEKLDVNLSGASNAKYKGSPNTINKRTSGASNIKEIK